MKTILIAAREKEHAFLVGALSDEYDVVPCTSWRDAESALDRNVSLVICSSHFDGSRLYDLVDAVKSNPFTHNVPFYGIVVADLDYSRRFIKCMRTALQIIGAQGALDLAGLRNDCGDTEATAMLKTAVEGILMNAGSQARAHLPRASADAPRTASNSRRFAARKHMEFETYES